MQQKYLTSPDWWTGNADGLKEFSTRKAIGSQRSFKARYV
jgi:hypothetical protein